MEVQNMKNMKRQRLLHSNKKLPCTQTSSHINQATKPGPKK